MVCGWNVTGRSDIYGSRSKFDSVEIGLWMAWLRQRWRRIVTFLEWLASLFGSNPKPQPTPPPPINLDVVRARVIALHNQYRIAHGLSALTANAKLTIAAQSHADDMATHKNLSHTGSNGSTPFERMTKVGYAWSTASENVAEGYATADAVMSAWEGDQPHLANIRGPYREIGVGRSGSYWCCDLASPR
jgi:uncharacterized protein YkwD